MKKIIILILCFHFSIASCNSETKLVLDRPSTQRIKDNISFYKQSKKKAKKFKRNFFIGGTVTSVSLSALITYLIKRPKAEKKSTPASQSAPTQVGSQPVQRVFWRNGTILETENLTLKDLCKLNFADTVTKGFFLGLGAAVFTGGAAIVSKISGITLQKFLESWQGLGEKSFDSLARQIGFDFEQLKTFFFLDGAVCDKQELKDNYSILIQVIEHLQAFVLAQSEKLIRSNLQTYQIIVSAQKLIFNNVINFTENLENILNENDQNRQKLDDSVWLEFKRLNNQIVRFIKLSHSVLYENNKNLS